MEVGGTIYDCGLQRVGSAATSRVALDWLGSARLKCTSARLGSAQQAARTGSRWLGSG